jgi:N-methylhydantoinase B
MPSTVDPVTVQIVRHRLASILDEAVIALENVSASPITTEGHDLMVALYTADVELLQAGVGFLHHVTSGAQAVRQIIERFGADGGMADGDVYFFNDSYSGALHAPDVYLISPVYVADRLVGFVANFVHVTDIGGIDPGGFCPTATDAYQEGFQSQGLRLVERNSLCRDIFDTILNNVREPGMVALDLKSQMAANFVAADRLRKLHHEFGSDSVAAISEGMVAESESVMRARLNELPDGEWRAREYVDSDGGSYRAELTVCKQGDSLTYDFTGSDPQAPIGINCSYWSTWGALLAPVFPMLAWDVTWNEGVTRPVRLIAPEGSVVNAIKPAPVSIATVSMVNVVNSLSTVVISKMLGASPRWRHRATAVWYGSHAPVMCHGASDDDESHMTELTDVFAGAGGATARADGIDLGGEIPNVVSRWANVEHHELSLPLLYLYRRIVTDSGGAGKFRGGLSHEYAFMPHHTRDGSLGLICYGKGVDAPMSLGLFGGYPGCHTGYVTVRNCAAEFVDDAELSLDHVEQEHSEWGARALGHDDSQHIRLTGGGGYGDPLDRDPQAVADDVRERAVSPQVAREVYGVVSDASSGATAAADTEELRRLLRAARIGCAPTDLRPRAEVLDSGMPIAEYLQLTIDGATQCAWCGLEIAPEGTDWKSAAAVRRRAAPDCGPLYGNTPRFWLLEVSCPGCGTLLDVDVTDGRDGLLFDRIQPRGADRVGG